MVFKYIIGASCACLAVVSFNAGAAVITYDEVTDGDLPGYGYLQTPTSYFNLGVGINTFSGTMTWGHSTSGNITDWDDIPFTISEGTRLDSITYSVELVPGGSGVFNNTSYGIYLDFFGGTGTELGNVEYFSIPTNGLNAFLQTLPLGSNDYILNQNSLGGEFQPGDYRSAAYTWEFEVSAIPIPSAVWLFGSGLISLIGVARRKK